MSQSNTDQHRDIDVSPEETPNSETGITIQDLSSDPFDPEADETGQLTDVNASQDSLSAIDQPSGLSLEDLSDDPFEPQDNDDPQNSDGNEFEGSAYSVSYDHATSLYEQSEDDSQWFDSDTDSSTVQSLDNAITVDDNFDFSLLEGILAHDDVIDVESSTVLNIGSGFTEAVQGEGYAVRIDGDHTQHVSFEQAYSDEGITNIEGRDYQTYTHEDTTIFIDTDITVLMP